MAILASTTATRHTATHVSKQVIFCRISHVCSVDFFASLVKCSILQASLFCWTTPQFTTQSTQCVEKMMCYSVFGDGSIIFLQITSLNKIDIKMIIIVDSSNLSWNNIDLMAKRLTNVYASTEMLFSANSSFASLHSWFEDTALSATKNGNKWVFQPAFPLISCTEIRKKPLQNDRNANQLR